MFCRAPERLLGCLFGCQTEYTGSPSTAGRSTRIFLRRKEIPGPLSAAGKSTEVLLRAPEGVLRYSFGRTTEALLLWEYLDVPPSGGVFKCFSRRVSCYPWKSLKRIPYSYFSFCLYSLTFENMFFVLQSSKKLLKACV